MTWGEVLWDLDGTLTDPSEGILNSLRFALGALSLECPSDAVLRRFIGPPLWPSFRSLLKSDEQADAALATYREYFSSQGLYENELVEGVDSLLTELTTADRRCFVATSKPKVYADRILSHLEIDGYFEACYGPGLDALTESKAELIGRLLAKEHVEPSNAVMVGDTVFDVQASAHHRIACIGVGWGTDSVATLMSAGAAAVCESVSELGALLVSGTHSG